ncbi:hypothetical protein BBJ28_00008637 [Nothophytophthora sp. Chile5]|nr:hypothetical protein BBJ28_00008637 [Nothophytophthora sp. Chile5]
MLRINKKPEETYSNYPHRLCQIAVAPNKGIGTVVMKEEALDSFVKTVLPQKRGALIDQVRRNSGNSDEQLETVVEHLTQIVGNDGRRWFSAQSLRITTPGVVSKNQPAVT